MTHQIAGVIQTGMLIKSKQYAFVIVTISAVTGLGLAFRDEVGYREVAFILLLVVSIMALFLDIWPVVTATCLSALAWDYLFIPPRFTLSVGTREDKLLLITYFLVALLHAVLTSRIRKAQKEISKREEKVNSVKYYNTLLNSLSHELRTPITTIIGAVDNMLSSDGNLSQKDTHILTEEISQAALRLNHQVENLLNMSRLESGVFKVKKDWCDVRELIYNSLQRLEPSLKDFPVSIFIPDDLPLFKLDYGLTEQVLSNLLVNVTQHTKSGTSVIIKAACADEKLVLTLGDTGSGFPEGEVEKVFEKFYRVKGSQPGGTGLGLSIVRGFVEAQGGKISLRNLPLSGAEYTMIFETEISYLTGLKNE